MVKKFFSFCLSCLIFSFSVFNLYMIQNIGILIGFIISKFDTKISRVAKKNIDLCFPRFNKKEKEKLLYKVISNMSITGLEMFFIFSRNTNRSLKYIKHIYGEEKLKNLSSENRGLMVLGPHIGCYELGAMYFAQNYDTSMLYTPAKIDLLNNILLASRSRLCSDMASADLNGIKLIIDKISKRNVVAMLTDQVPVNAGGCYMDFFGIPTKTMTLPDKLYKKFRPAIIISYLIRNKIGYGYSLYIENLEPLIKKHNAMMNPVAYCFTKRYESIIKKFPEQYQWTYKRFKYNPNNIDFYKG